ncbi:MAG: ankyrin repeat domain-containing protein [Planctomycetota bacterium]|nr:MAG: ankyrin repeat domain-containing protein [Planctomycetota bacterium]
MKLSLPIKLAIFVLVLFALVITTCLLWTPVKIRYYRSMLDSPNITNRVKAVGGLVHIGEKGRQTIIESFPDGEDAALLLIRFWDNCNGIYSDNAWSVPIQHYAAYRGYQELFQILIARSADSGKSHVDVERTPLHYAAMSGKCGIIKILIDRGVSLEEKDHLGYTALHQAIREDQEDAVRMLVKVGANIHARTVWLRTPICLASIGGRRSIAAFLISKGANVDDSDIHKRTALHLAAFNGEKETVRLLIEKGANINVQDFEGNTPLDSTYKKGQMETASLLRSHGGKTGEELKAEQDKK